MNRETLIKKIKTQARQDKANRRDPRFLGALSFLVGKGFLKTNIQVRPAPNRFLRIEDAIWAGQNVEPRILEVLPAAVLLFRNHFNFNRRKHADLANVIDLIRNGSEVGPSFFGMPFDKVRFWTLRPPKDRRVKLLNEKRVTKTFRMKPASLRRLKEIARKMNCTQTEALEKKLLE